MRGLSITIFQPRKTKPMLSAVATHNNNNKNNNMEFKGTKGKWKYEVIYGKKRPKITVQIPITEDFYKELLLGTIGEDDCTVASCCCQEEHANALLISKAPEMLEMLEKLRGYGAEYGMPNKLYIELEQLIKEATEL